MGAMSRSSSSDRPCAATAGPLSGAAPPPQPPRRARVAGGPRHSRYHSQWLRGPRGPPSPPRSARRAATARRWRDGACGPDAPPGSSTPHDRELPGFPRQLLPPSSHLGRGGGHCISLSGQKDTILSTQPICMEGGAPGPAKSRREVAPPLRPPLTPVCMTCACKSKHKKIGKTMPRASRMTAAGRFGGAGQVSTAELCRRPRSTADGWRHTWPRGCAAAAS